jgi:hypothetical protein
MKKANVGVLGAFGLGIGLVAAACGGSADVPVLQDSPSDLGIIDAGTGKCGDNVCATGELCCESADESCSPTCTNVTKCPVYGRACKVDGGAADGGSGDGGATGLAWYATCGDPVCRPPQDSGVPPVVCPPLGSPCTDKGLNCGDRATSSCGVIQVCGDQPTNPETCPVSSKKFKEDIGYVDDAKLQRLHDETLQMRLATYRYKGPFINTNDPNATHLGFIIEDQPQSLSVERGHDRVDLYGYMSMAVATMQVQEKEISQLKRDLADVKASCAQKTR